MITRTSKGKFHLNSGYYVLVTILLLAQKLLGHTNYIMLLLVIASAFFLVLRRATPLDICMIGLILPGEIWVLSMLILSIIFMRLKGTYWKIPNCPGTVKVCLLVILALAVGNAIYTGGVFNTIFYIVYLLLLFFLVLVLHPTVEQHSFYRICLKLCWIQIILSILEVFKSGQLKPGDNYSGSLGDAHEFGIWLLFMITFMLYQLKKGSNKCLNLCTLLGCLFALYLSDAKHVLLAYILGAILYLFVKGIKIKSHMISGMIIFAIISLYIGTFSLQIPIIKQYVSQKAGVYSVYLYDSNYNYKYNYFFGTLSEEMRGLRLFVGYGLGQYGSRGANLFAYDIMYRNDNALNRFIATHFSPVHIDNYKKYAEIYTTELVNSIRWRSAVLTYPFNSFLAFMAENGLIGMICWGVLINKFFRRSNYKLLLCFFIMVCLFDLYIDRINIIGTLIVLLFVGKEASYEENSFYHALPACRRSGGRYSTSG